MYAMHAGHAALLHMPDHQCARVRACVRVLCVCCLYLSFGQLYFEPPFCICVKSSYYRFLHIVRVSNACMQDGICKGFRFLVLVQQKLWWSSTSSVMIL